jgi:flagellar basal body rod protein FlgG
MNVTDNPLDMAIGGDGFFQIKMPDGETRLTRSGAFHLSPQGSLVDAMGRTVLDENKAPMNLNPEGGKIFIDSAGGVHQGNERVGAIGVVSVEDTSILQKKGANTFIAKEGEELQTAPATDYTITQGALEASNVVVVREMVGMIDSFRAFESYQKAIHTMGEIDSKAANQVGRVG